MKALTIAAAFALAIPAAQAQSSPPQICNFGADCIQDANGSFVGVVNGRAFDGFQTVAHVFNGQTYQIEVDGLGPAAAPYDGLIKSTIFYYTVPCPAAGAQPYLADDDVVPDAKPDNDGTLYAAARPILLTEMKSLSYGLNGPCQNSDLFLNVGKAYSLGNPGWKAPFSPIGSKH